MTVRTSRAITATILAGVVTATGFLTATPAAQAEPVNAASGTFTVTGDPDDPITGGATYSYDVAAGDRLSVGMGTDQRAIGVSVAGANGDSWSMELWAAPEQQLAVGSYPFAIGPSGAGVGIDIHGNGRSCGFERETFQTGSFVITELSFSPSGYVERLDATFEQHCNGGDPALRGQVVIGNPPPPAELELNVTTAANGVFSKLNGKATVHGTVVCSEDATVDITGQVTQVKKKVIIRGPFSREVDCVAGETVPWSATADPTGTTPFQKGKVEVTGGASATDPNYPTTTVQVDLAPTTVTLTRAQPAVEARM